MKTKAKRIAPTVLAAAKKHEHEKNNQVDLVDFLDEIDLLSSIECCDEGGFRIFVETSLPGRKTYRDWETSASKLLESVGFICSEWGGEFKPMKRSVLGKGSEATFEFVY